ncbi:MAG: hypothetical protein ICV66_06370, partial [Chitinophagaceae bacterium]|nr:hypothetical protein [Chitinophagaceae bacterium]
MAKLSLKSILKNAGTFSTLTLTVDALEAPVCIKDDTGKILFSTGEVDNNFEYPVKADDEVIGLVQGNKKALIIAHFLNNAVQKESEKKKLGAEVLTLYQEINLVFNFSEKLAQTIDAPSICSITLEEAKHVINSDNGVIVLWDEKQKKIQVLS